jgi:hypothetical protein
MNTLYDDRFWDRMSASARRPIVTVGKGDAFIHWHVGGYLRFCVDVLVRAYAKDSGRRHG